MKGSNVLRTALVAIALAWPSTLAGQSADLVRTMSDLAWAGEVDRAMELIESERADAGEATPEWLAAVSWMARGASFEGRWDVADRYATEALEGSLALLEERPLDAERMLPTALGAAIEVIGQAYDARGDNAAAVGFLTEARRQFAGTSIEMRIQKNVLLVSVEGGPFPHLEVNGYLTPPEVTMDDLEDKVVLFFFWAHWCPDCKRQEPILRDLYDEYHDRGLEIVAPTQFYGFISRGQPATPAEELEYMRGEYLDQYPLPPWMSVPMGAGNFVNFGVSTTPTMVLVDRDGIVQRYNPGDMSYEELAALIEPLL